MHPVFQQTFDMFRTGPAGRPHERELLVSRENANDIRTLSMATIVPVLFTMVVIASPADTRGLVLLGAFTVIVANILGYVLPWQRMPRWTEAVLPIVCIVSGWLMAAAAGGFGNGLSVLVLPPIMWLALYADPPDVLAGLLALYACVLSPLADALSLPDQGEPLSTTAQLAAITLISLMLRPLVVELRSRIKRQERLARSLRASQAALAHDIRTPITSSVALATMASERIGDGTPADLRAAREYTDQIVDLGWRADATISGVLELSEAGDALPEARPIDLPRLLRDVAESVGEIDLELGPLPQQVVGHPVSLARAFNNLFRNAVEHAHPPGRRRPVRIRVDGESTSQGWRIHVRDDGRGISPDEHHLLFEPWRRGSTARSGGSGLGLAIVAAIIEQHGGTISITDTPDDLDLSGSTFTIELSRTPRVRRHEEAATS